MRKKISTQDSEWENWRSMMNHFNSRTQALCRSASATLLSRDLPEGCGISSSDINHRLFSLWKEAEKNETYFLGLCAQVVFQGGN
jgi:hypothetical protein